MAAMGRSFLATAVMVSAGALVLLVMVAATEIDRRLTDTEPPF